MMWIRTMVVVICITMHGFCDAKTYIIGVDQINPPMSIRADSSDHFIGFEIDIMNEICSRLKLDCAYKAVRANQIINDLEMGTIDFAIDSIIIPKYRLYGLVLSLPYLASSDQFMALSSSPIQTVDDISSKVVGVRLGAFQMDVNSDMYIKHLFKSLTRIKGYYTMSELLEALKNKEVDVIFANTYASNYWATSNKEMFKFIGDKADIGNGYGIMSIAQNQLIMASINAAIEAIMDEGTYDKIFQRYFANFH